MQGFTDIRNDAWLLRVSPASWQPYLKLMRLDRPIGTWLLLIPCWWGLALSPAAADPSRWWELAWLALLFAVGATVMRGAGCTLNDIFDRDIDAQVERTRVRPLPSGQVSLPRALIFLAGQLLVGLLVLVQFNPTTVIVGAASLVIVAVYPLMKRVTYWPQFVLGLAFNWGALVGWTAAGAPLGWEMLPAFLLYAGGIFWTLGYDTVYAHQDIKDDEAAGVKSTARLFQQHSRKAVAVFFGLQILLLGLAGLQAGLALTIYLPLLLVAGWKLATDLRRWRMYDQAVSLAHFKAHRMAGILVLLAILCGRVAAG